MAYTFTSQPFTEEGQSRNSVLELEVETMEDCCLLPCSQSLDQLAFFTSWAHLPRDSATHSGQGPPAPILSRDNLSQV